MRGRDPHQPHRVTTPLELLFDLTFVIAFGTAANQFAHFLASEWRRHGSERVEVHARDRISMNKHTPQWLVDPDVDLAAEPMALAPSRWITELKEPLPPAPERR